MTVVPLFLKLCAPIKKGWNAVRPQDNTDEERTDSQDKRTDTVPPKPDSPPAPPNQRKSHNKCSEFREWVTFVLEVLGLIGLGIYAYLTYLMYCETKKAADAAKSAAETAKTALENGQRAFVFSSFTQGQEVNNLLRVSLKLENHGSTPAENMTMHASFSGLMSHPLPNNFPFPDIWAKGEPHAPANVALGTKGSLTAIEVRIPFSSFKGKRFYIWGWAKYHDVFPGTHEHITRFCDEFESLILYPNAINVRPLGMNACGRYNCEDTQCQNQP